MELVEAFELLTVGSSGEVAKRALTTIRACALRCARGDDRCDEATAQDCAQVVLSKLWTRFALGDNPVRRAASEACAAYIQRMVRNWIHDRCATGARRREIREGIRERAQNNSAAPPPMDRESVSETVERQSKQVRELLARVAEHAIAARRVQHRHHLERGWKEIRQLVFDGLPMSAVLEEPEASPQWKSLRDAAYKRHQRAREALSAAAADLEERGLLTPADAQLAELAIAGLARRARENT